MGVHGTISSCFRKGEQVKLSEPTQACLSNTLDMGEIIEAIEEAQQALSTVPLYHLLFVIATLFHNSTVNKQPSQSSTVVTQ